MFRLHSCSYHSLAWRKEVNKLVMLWRIGLVEKGIRETKVLSTPGGIHV